MKTNPGLFFEDYRGCGVLTSRVWSTGRTGGVGRSRAVYPAG